MQRLSRITWAQCNQRGPPRGKQEGRSQDAVRAEAQVGALGATAKRASFLKKLEHAGESLSPRPGRRKHCLMAVGGHPNQPPQPPGTVTTNGPSQS